MYRRQIGRRACKMPAIESARWESPRAPGSPLEPGNAISGITRGLPPAKFASLPDLPKGGYFRLPRGQYPGRSCPIKGPHFRDSARGPSAGLSPESRSTCSCGEKRTRETSSIPGASRRRRSAGGGREGRTRPIVFGRARKLAARNPTSVVARRVANRGFMDLLCDSAAPCTHPRAQVIYRPGAAGDGFRGEARARPSDLSTRRSRSRGRE